MREASGKVFESSFQIIAARHGSREHDVKRWSEVLLEKGASENIAEALEALDFLLVHNEKTLSEDPYEDSKGLVRPPETRRYNMTQLLELYSALEGDESLVEQALEQLEELPRNPAETYYAGPRLQGLRLEQLLDLLMQAQKRNPDDSVEERLEKVQNVMGQAGFGSEGEED